MTQRCWRFLTRVLPAVVALVAFGGVAALHAQATGKIQGYIRDAQQQPIPNAQIVIVGTAFSAHANPQGYYFIENIPAGLVSVRVAYINYRPQQKDGVRVLAGQTVDLNYQLEVAPVALDTLVAETQAKNTLVPRDQSVSKQDITGDVVQQLPVDRIAQALALQPGVTQVTNCSTNGNGNGSSTSGGCTPLISVRGGRVDQNATYIDGVPVQTGVHTGQSSATGAISREASVNGPPQLQVATNGFEEASITTGGSSAEYGNAQGGIINIATKTGGNKFSGNLNYETGLLGLAQYGQGVNIFAGALSGPITKNLTFFVSGRVEGNNSTNGGNHGWLYPGYAAVGVDTQYTVPTGGNAGKAAAVDSQTVSVYNYAVVEGACNANSLAPGVTAYQGSSFAPIASNYGQTCHSNQAYTSPNTNYFTTDKLSYTFGQGSRIALSYIFSGNQNRNALSDGATQGVVQGSNVAILNWTQTLIRNPTHQLSIDAYLSRQWNNTTTAPLTASSESSTRSSPLGIITHKLQFAFTPDQYPVDSTLILNTLLNKAGTRIGIRDNLNTGQYGGQASFTTDLPPDGVYSGAAAGGGGGDPINNIGLTYDISDLWVGKLDIDFQADRYNRLHIGGEYSGWTNFTDYASNTTGFNVFTGKPVEYDGYAEDHLDLGDVVVVGGVRYDYYWSKAWRWNEYPEISTRPGFTPDSLFCPVGTTPSATAKCALVQDPSHNYVSPHMQVAFPVTPTTNFRLSYAQQVQAPDFGLIYTNALSDINTSGINSRGTWGQDLDFGKTIAFEFGARHAFSDDMVLDVSVYNNDIVADPSYSFQHPIDPVSGQPGLIYEAENTDFGNTRGIDVRLDRRIGNYFNGTLTYSFQDSKNTGTDPFSYLGFFEPLSGFVGQPPTAALPTGLSRPHSLTALFNVQLPPDWEKGNIFGAILNQVGAYVTARYASGLAYTQCDPTDPTSIGVTSGNPCGSLGAVVGYNASRLPAIKQLDLRLTKNFRIGRYQFQGYMDGRNILNLTNVIGVYSQTGTTSSGAQVQALWASDSGVFANYGNITGERNAATGAITLPSTIAGCGKVTASGNSMAPECYYYIRSEQRFGNGDGVYTVAEQRVASNSRRAFTNSIWNFVTGARTIRFGLEMNF